MMKKQSANRILDFFAGKGFYLVLFVCVLAIAISGYALFFSSAPDATDLGNAYLDNINDALNEDWDLPDQSNVDLGDSSQVGDFDLNDDDTGAIPVFGETLPSAAPPSVNPANESPSPAPSPTPEAKASEKPKQAALTYAWPVQGQVITPFAKDELIYDQTMADYRVHMGIDIGTSANAKVTAIADGKVTDIYEDSMLGTVVVVEHGKSLESIYGNLNKTPAVKVGDSVSKGDLIGAVSTSALGEAALGNHLHLAIVKDDEPVDPQTVLPQKTT